MKKFIKVLFVVVMSIFGFAIVLLSAGYINGLYQARKHDSKMIADRTFFGLTLDQCLDASQCWGVDYNDSSLISLSKDFSIRKISDELYLVPSPVKLTKPFFGIEYANAFVSQHNKKILGMALCKSFRETYENKPVDDFGDAEVLCEKIRTVIEEKHSCKMTPFNCEPSFVKKFILPPCPSLDLSIMRIEANVKTESNVFVSPKSCFVATSNFVASIFVIGFREIITSPALKRLDKFDSADTEPPDRSYHNKNYVILLIHSPSLDIQKEKTLIEQDYKLREEDRKREEREAYKRELKEALDAM